MLTQIGIFLKNLRLESGEMMKEMATKLNVSSSFLSKVENGKKKIPDSWYNIIVNSYNLDGEKQDELKKMIENPHKDLNKEKNKLTLEDINEKEIKEFFKKTRK